MVDGAESWVVTSQRDDSEYGVVVDPGVEHPGSGVQALASPASPIGTPPGVSSVILNRRGAYPSEPRDHSVRRRDLISP